MIIGITGTIGAGKGTVVEYLQQKGFAHYSVRDFLIEEAAKRGLPVSRDSLRELGNEIRAAHRPSHIVEELFHRAKIAADDAVIESVRSIGEAEFLKSKGALLLAIDADRRLRFERVQSRASATDDVDFDTFVAHEEQELASTDPSGQNLIGVMRMADYRIENDGTLEELHRKVDECIAQAGL